MNVNTHSPGTLYPRIVVAGTRGGSGKTTVSLGLIAAWRRQGLAVTPFKKGPDYIDAGWLSAAAGVGCYNLDPFFFGRQQMRASFERHYGTAACAVIEGNRGYFDGMDALGTCSTSELARMLDAPVLLVVDCTKATRTIGALVLGMLRFERTARIRGVVLNQIAGSRHERVIREVIDRECGVPVVGAIPRSSEAWLAERHMGLTPFQEHPEVRRTIRAARGLAEKYLDLEAIRRIAEEARPWKRRKMSASRPHYAGRLSAEPLRIGVIRDSAFQFYYPENFEALEDRGATLVEISALTARSLPSVDALYIGGGFPETHAVSLARNVLFRRAIREAVESGLPVYAECGGLMFLGEELEINGKRYPMAGVFPLSFVLEKRPQAHGYTIVDVTDDNPYFPKGAELRGHEFHYSRVVRARYRGGMRYVFGMRRGTGIRNRLDGICYRNVLATYTHLHAIGTPAWADGLTMQALLHRQRRKHG
ncbi:MAG: hydrogenobyrinic acid a,c-diamide synthase (glutamine-hydrolyzing) [Thermodesulfovibrionales bacterium]